MTNEIRDDDLVRLPEGHVVRGCDYFEGMTGFSLSSRVGTTVSAGGGDYYCRRKDYPKPKRKIVLQEWVAKGLDDGWMSEYRETAPSEAWIATGNTRTIELPDEACREE